MLKKLSLVIYGTAQQPYPAHRERVRSAEWPTDGDLTEEYNGGSCTGIKLCLVLRRQQLYLLYCNTHLLCSLF